MPRDLLSPMLQNSRNSTLPSQDFIDGTTQKFHEQFEGFFRLKRCTSGVTNLKDTGRPDTREPGVCTKIYPWTANECITECNTL